MTNQDSITSVEKSSIKKTVVGVGYNSGGFYKSRVNGIKTPEYKSWYEMIRRCYCPNKLLEHPSYKDCVVCDEWLDFQNFAHWFVNHVYYNKGYELDKDLLVCGNKIYSKDTCSLVPKSINTLFVDRRSSRGEYPIGVNYHKASGRFVAQLSVDGKRIHLGLFSCVDEAYACYVLAKEAHVKLVANQQKDNISEPIFNALMSWSAD